MLTGVVHRTTRPLTGAGGMKIEPKPFLLQMDTSQGRKKEQIKEQIKEG